jgi:hypothetical protein
VALETPSGNGEALEISKTPSVYPEKKNTCLPLNITLLIGLSKGFKRPYLFTFWISDSNGNSRMYK